jgi:hypothetical protein
VSAHSNIEAKAMLAELMKVGDNEICCGSEDESNEPNTHQ